MPKTKDGGFLMDDGDMMPYKVPPKKSNKRDKSKTAPKKSGSGKKK